MAFIDPYLMGVDKATLSYLSLLSPMSAHLRFILFLI